MRRTREGFVGILNGIIALDGAKILEIGCGEGHYSRSLDALASELAAIDPDADSIERAKQTGEVDNTTYSVGDATDLRFEADQFDVVIFTLSLHHVPKDKMVAAIVEASRVVSPTGHVVFLEPAEDGTFFDAEIHFDACDGDEGVAKSDALAAIRQTEHLSIIDEREDQTVFVFDSCQDFIDTFGPTKNLGDLPDFLDRHNMTLTASRRISVLEPVR